MTINEFKNYLDSIKQVVIHCKDTNANLKCILSLIISSAYQIILQSIGYDRYISAFRNIKRVLQQEGVIPTETLTDILEYRNNLAHIIDFNNAVQNISKHTTLEFLNEFEILMKFIENNNSRISGIRLRQPTINASTLIDDVQQKDKSIVIDSDDINYLIELLELIPPSVLQDEKYLKLLNKLNFQIKTKDMNLF